VHGLGSGLMYSARVRTASRQAVRDTWMNRGPFNYTRRYIASSHES